MDPAQLAAVHVKHLEQHPLDAEVREKLAIIYAEHYQRLDLATLELEQLIEQPEQPAKRVAYWLNLLADLQIRLGSDYETVRPTLEKIVERFPDLPVAEMAQTRLDRLKLELSGALGLLKEESVKKILEKLDHESRMIRKLLEKITASIMERKNQKFQTSPKERGTSPA